MLSKADLTLRCRQRRKEKKGKTKKNEGKRMVNL